MAANQTQTINDPNALKNLESSCGLTLYTTPNLAYFQCHGDKNHYAANLDILVNGQKAIGHNWLIEAGDPFFIDTKRYKQFITKLNEDHVLTACNKLTPAGQSRQLVTGGLIGIDALMTSQMMQNPMNGPAQNTHSLGADLLNSIDPNMVTNIENICNIIRTRSYLSLPPSALGGLQTFLYKAQGAVQGFVQALYDLYNGVILLMQRFANMISGLLAGIGHMVYDFINSIIPLDLLCAILGAAQSLLDDVAFFAQLFDGGDALFNTINSVQTAINYAAETLNYCYNPLSVLSLVPGLNNIVAEFNQLLGDPQAFLGQMLAHYGFSAGANNKAIQIANAILLHYGLEGQLGPLGSVLLSAGVAGNSSQWYRTGNLGTGNYGNYAQGNITPNPTYFDPNNPLGFLDVNSNPYFSNVKTDVNQFTNNASQIPKAFADFITNPLA